MYPNTVHNELELLARAADGDHQAFSQLFEAFHQELGAYVCRLTGSLSMAEEIVQETFMKIWTGRAQLREVRSFRAFIFTVSRNQTYNTLRNEARKAVLHQKWATDLPVSEEPFPDRSDDRIYGYIEEAVALLPPQQQKAWRLSREEGLRHEEIAAQLQLSKKTVKRHIGLAIASITRYLKVHAVTLAGVLVQFRVLFW